MKVLNLYAGIGGNRKLWNDSHKITAIENDKEIASVYSDLYPSDEVIVADAMVYLINNYMNFDFIWSSPPCQTHSQIRFNIGFKANRIYEKVKAAYPEMSLYQQIILLDNYFDGKWIVENTIPYYEPLIPGKQVGGHIFWSNFNIAKFDIGNRNHRGGTVETLSQRKQIDLSKYSIKNKRQILRNCVEPELGLHILNCAMKNEPEQIGLFKPVLPSSPQS